MKKIIGLVLLVSQAAMGQLSAKSDKLIDSNPILMARGADSTSLNGIVAMSDDNSESNIAGFVNVKSLGAKGDGKTDDRLALQNAINANTSLYFPDGDYMVSNELLVNKKITIRGSKNAHIIKNFSSANTALFKCKSSDVAISGLTIEGISTSKFVQNEYGIHVLGNASNIYNRIKISNNRLSNIGHAGICVEYCKDFTVLGNRINDINCTV